METEDFIAVKMFDSLRDILIQDEYDIDYKYLPGVGHKLIASNNMTIYECIGETKLDILKGFFKMYTPNDGDI